MALPPRFVIDTCAVEDLQLGKVLRPCLAASTVFIPDLLEHEIRDVTWSLYQTWGGQVSSLSGDELREVMMLSRERRALSNYDAAVLFVARRERLPLVTSNFKHVPSAAADHGVQVIGVLKVLEELVSMAVVDPPSAASAIKGMLSENSFLPEDDCERLIQRWSVAGP